MKASKFAQLAREFPFLSHIAHEQGLEADSISWITIMRGDQNLLEVTPATWAHDLGEWGNDEGYRHFWAIGFNGTIVKFDSSWLRSVVPHGMYRSSRGARRIGWQISDLGWHPLFITEVSLPNHEPGCGESDVSLVVYKMAKFDWSSCRPYR